MHNHVPVFLGQGKGGLPFKVEMFLSAHFDLTRQAMGCRAKCCVDVALGPDAGGVFEPAVGGKRIFNRQDRRGFIHVDIAQTGGLARVQVAVGHNQKQRLSKVMDRASRQ